MEEEGKVSIRGPVTRRRSGAISTPERTLRSKGEKSETTNDSQSTPKRTLRRSIVENSIDTPSKRNIRASSAQPETSSPNTTKRVMTRRRSSSLQPESPMKETSVTARRLKNSNVPVSSTDSPSSRIRRSSRLSESPEVPKKLEDLIKNKSSRSVDSPAKETGVKTPVTNRRRSTLLKHAESPTSSPDSVTDSTTPSNIPRKKILKNLNLSPVEEKIDEIPSANETNQVKPKDPVTPKSSPYDLRKSPDSTSSKKIIKECIVRLEVSSASNVSKNTLDSSVAKSEISSPHNLSLQDKNESCGESEDSGIKEMEEFNSLEENGSLKKDRPIKTSDISSEVFEDQNNDPNSKRSSLNSSQKDLKILPEENLKNLGHSISAISPVVCLSRLSTDSQENISEISAKHIDSSIENTPTVAVSNETNFKYEPDKSKIIFTETDDESNVSSSLVVDEIEESHNKESSSVLDVAPRLIETLKTAGVDEQTNEDILNKSHEKQRTPSGEDVHKQNEVNRTPIFFSVESTDEDSNCEFKLQISEDEIVIEAGSHSKTIPDNDVDTVANDSTVTTVAEAHIDTKETRESDEITEDSHTVSGDDPKPYLIETNIKELSPNKEIENKSNNDNQDKNAINIQEINEIDKEVEVSNELEKEMVHKCITENKGEIFTHLKPDNEEISTSLVSNMNFEKQHTLLQNSCKEDIICDKKVNLTADSETHDIESTDKEINELENEPAVISGNNLESSTMLEAVITKNQEEILNSEKHEINVHKVEKSEISSRVSLENFNNPEKMIEIVGADNKTIKTAESLNNNQCGEVKLLSEKEESIENLEETKPAKSSQDNDKLMKITEVIDETTEKQEASNETLDSNKVTEQEVLFKTNSLSEKIAKPNIELGEKNETNVLDDMNETYVVKSPLHDNKTELSAKMCRQESMLNDSSDTDESEIDVTTCSLVEDINNGSTDISQASFNNETLEKNLKAEDGSFSILKKYETSHNSSRLSVDLEETNKDKHMDSSNYESQSGISSMEHESLVKSTVLSTDNDIVEHQMTRTSSTESVCGSLESEKESVESSDKADTDNVSNNEIIDVLNIPEKNVNDKKDSVINVKSCSESSHQSVEENVSDDENYQLNELFNDAIFSADENSEVPGISESDNSIESSASDEESDSDFLETENTSSSGDDPISGRDFLDDEAEEGDESSDEEESSTEEEKSIVHIRKLAVPIQRKLRKTTFVEKPICISSEIKSSGSFMAGNKSWFVKNHNDAETSENKGPVQTKIKRDMANSKVNSDLVKNTVEKLVTLKSCKNIKSSTTRSVNSENTSKIEKNNTVSYNPSTCSGTTTGCGVKFNVIKSSDTIKDENQRPGSVTGCGVQFRVEKCLKSYKKTINSVNNSRNALCSGNTFTVTTEKEYLKFKAHRLYDKKTITSCGSQFKVSKIPSKRITSNKGVISYNASFKVSPLRLEPSPVTVKEISSVIPKSNRAAPLKSKVTLATNKNGNTSSSRSLTVSEDSSGDEESSYEDKSANKNYIAYIHNMGLGINAHNLHGLLYNNGITGIEEINFSKCNKEMFYLDQGYGSVTFSNEKELQRAVNLIQRSEINGTRLWMRPDYSYKPSSKQFESWLISFNREYYISLGKFMKSKNPKK